MVLHRQTPRRLGPAGFSLIEAIITLVLFMIILTAATGLFIQNQRVAASQVSLATLRANLRFATNTMVSELRQIGAFSKSARIQLPANSTWSISLLECNNTTFQAWGSASHMGRYTTYDGSIPDRIRVVEPDILNDCRLYEKYNKPSTQIKTTKLNSQTKFDANDLLIITNGNLVGSGSTEEVFADLFVATNVQKIDAANPFSEVVFNTGLDPYGINSTTGLSREYPINSSILRVRVWEYYVDTSDANLPKLYRVEGTSSVPELVAENVEDMQVAMGIDSNGDSNITDGTGGTPNEWHNSGFASLTAAQLVNLRAFRLSLLGKTGYVAQSMAGKKGTNDINYKRPALEDRPEGAESSLPVYREVYSQVLYFRNLRPQPTT